MLMTKPRSNPSTPVRVRSPHSITITASPGSSMRFATSIADAPGKTAIGAGTGSRLTRRTSLSRCQSAKAIASCEPIASPSGRTCDESTKRCRVRIWSAIRAMTVCSVAVVIVWGVGGGEPGAAFLVLLVQVPEDLFDAVLVLDGFVEAELELRLRRVPE